MTRKPRWRWMAWNRRCGSLSHDVGSADQLHGLRQGQVVATVRQAAAMPFLCPRAEPPAAAHPDRAPRVCASLPGSSYRAVSHDVDDGLIRSPVNTDYPREAFSGRRKNYHTDVEMARALGFPDIVVQEMMSVCFVAELSTSQYGEGFRAGGKLDVRGSSTSSGPATRSRRAAACARSSAKAPGGARTSTCGP